MVNNYDTDALNEICSDFDLLEYASNSMDFEKRGSDSYATHCPLHVDKTPSLYITPSKNLFHCFSCGRGGTIINWMMEFESLSYHEAVNKLCSIVGTDIKKLKQCSSLSLFKTIKRYNEQPNEKSNIVREILEPSEIDKFSKEYPIEWLDEGISKKAMDVFNIRIDENSNRIVYPVYDKEFNLIGFKGRTRYENYKDIGIQKYMNYTTIGTTDFFVGMKEQYKEIRETKKIIIFEGLKSVMKAYGWGYCSIASETSYLNDEQVKILIQMGIKDITIAFDTDVEMKKILECTKQLRKFTNVYVIIDRKNISNKLLGEKEAPADRGREIFETLLLERKKL